MLTPFRGGGSHHALVARWTGIGPLGLTICIGLGIVFGLGGYTFHYAEGLSYLGNDPRTCVNCHIMRDQYDGWQHASHHAVATCNDCHTPHDFIGKYATKAENGFWHSKGFTLQDFHEPIRIRPAKQAPSSRPTASPVTRLWSAN